MSESDEQRVLITGASSGIGLVTALYLAERGYSVIGTSRSLDRLAELEEAASKRGLDVTSLELDVNSDAGVQAVVPGVLEKHGTIDVLVNNAGYNLWGPAQSLSMEELKAQFETNLFATVRLAKAVLPGMIERRRGTIINVSSIAGRIATPFNGGYAASKFALEGLSEAMRVELWPLGVRVVLVEPGLFRTRLFENQVIAADVESADLPYRPYVDKYRARRRKFERLTADPVKVARVIHKAIRSRRPAFRYLVGREAWLGVYGKRFLPERLFQALLSRATIGKVGR